MIKCPNCGLEVDDGFKFCSSCGTPIPQTKKCVKCGAELAMKMAFCHECGAPQNAPEPAAGINIGAKSVIAGDVINTTNITNNVEMKKAEVCSCCGKVINSSDYYTCSDCGESVCSDCYIPSKSKCKKCDNKQRSLHKDETVKVVSVDGSSFYSSIREAVEDSVSGHVIKIKTGVYTEHFIVDKNVTIEAYDENNHPCIKLDGINSITVKSDCKISNIVFKTEKIGLQNAEQGILNIVSGNVNITCCDFNDCDMSAIHTVQEAHVNVSNCTFTKVKGNPFWICDYSSCCADSIKIIDCVTSSWQTTKETVIKNIEITDCRGKIVHLHGTSKLSISNLFMTNCMSEVDAFELENNATLELVNSDISQFNSLTLVAGYQGGGYKNVSFNECKIHDCNIKNFLFLLTGHNGEDGILSLKNCSIYDNKIGTTISKCMNTEYENVSIERNTIEGQAVQFFKGKLNLVKLTGNQLGSFVKIFNDFKSMGEFSNLVIEKNEFNKFVFDAQLSESSKIQVMNVKISENSFMDSCLYFKQRYPSLMKINQFEITNNDIGSSIIVFDELFSPESPAYHSVLENGKISGNKLTGACIFVNTGNRVNLNNVQITENTGTYGIKIDDSPYDIIVNGSDITLSRSDNEPDTSAIYIGRRVKGKVKISGLFKGFGTNVNYESKYHEEVTVSLNNTANTTPLLALAEQGDAKAQWELARIYLNGKEVPVDVPKALEFYEKSAAQGYGPALNSLGVLYTNGEVVKLDKSKAYDYFMKGAELGYAPCQENVGWFYRDGVGDVPQDYKKAYEWYMKAALQGNADAQENIGCLYANGTGVPKDYTKAKEWLKKAADQGKKSAKETLDDILEMESSGAMALLESIDKHQQEIDRMHKELGWDDEDSESEQDDDYEDDDDDEEEDYEEDDDSEDMDDDESEEDDDNPFSAYSDTINEIKDVFSDMKNETKEAFKDMFGGFGKIFKK